MYNVGGIVGPFFAGSCAYDYFPASRPTFNLVPFKGPLLSPCRHVHGYIRVGVVLTQAETKGHFGLT